VIAQAVEAAEIALGSNDPRIFLYDAHGSVRQLVDKLGDVVKIALDKAEVNDVHKIDYEAYGEAINAAISTAVTQLLYSGEFTDAINNNQYLRARYYDIASGRFTRVDQFSGNFQVPQSLNKYGYGHGDPISHTVPSGEFILTAFLITVLVGAAIGGGLGVAVNGFGNMMNGDPFFQNWVTAGQIGFALGGMFGVAVGVGLGPGAALAGFGWAGYSLKENGGSALGVLFDAQTSAYQKGGAIGYLFSHALLLGLAGRGMLGNPSRAIAASAASAGARPPIAGSLESMRSLLDIYRTNDPAVLQQRPTMSAIAVHKGTGQRAFGMSGQTGRYTMPRALAEQARALDPGAEPWSVGNCAEPHAAANLMNQTGASLSDIVVLTVRTRTGAVAQPCSFCQGFSCGH